MAGITVSGQGQAAGPADMLSIAARVALSRTAVADAVADAAAAATRLREAVMAVGVAPADVSTASFYLEPEHDPDEHRRIIGYRVDHGLAVTVRDLTRAGEVLDATTTSSGDDVRVSGVTFDITDKTALAVTARRGAWEDARARADQLAGQAGLTLGGPLSIDETVASPPGPIARMAMGPMDASSPITAGEQTVTVSITVTFAIDA